MRSAGIDGGDEEGRLLVTHTEDRTNLIPLVTPLAVGDHRRREHKQDRHGYDDASEANPCTLASSLNSKCLNVQHDTGLGLLSHDTDADHFGPLDRNEIKKHKMTEYDNS